MTSKFTRFGRCFGNFNNKVAIVGAYVTLQTVLIEPIEKPKKSWDNKTKKIWNECEQKLPQFDNLYGTMAHSHSTVFKNIWQEMLDYYNKDHFTSDQLRYFEIGVSIVSILNKCHFCVSHHADDDKFAANLSEKWDHECIDYLVNKLKLDRNCPLLDDIDELNMLRKDIKDLSGVDEAEKEYAVMNLAYHLCYYIAFGREEPGVTYKARHQIWKELDAVFGNDKYFMESLIWRLSQCIAFNAHNDFLELN